MSSGAQAATQRKMYFSEKNLRTIKSSENEQSEFKKLVATSKAYSETEKAAVNCNSFEEFDAFWTRLNDDQEGFDQSHQRGCGLFMRNYQDAAVQARSLAKDFSPIIELVKDFASPYGGIAVGTISVLFVVASNKSELEKSLTAVMSEISDRLPGLKLFRHIYNDEHELDMKLQARIVSAYQGFIEFCIEASKYYKGGGPRRWSKALGTSNSILDKASRVQAVIGDIRRLCDELLDKNVDYIKQQNKEQKADIERLEDKIRQLLTTQDDTTLSEIQRLLNLSAFSDENYRKEFTHHCEALDSDEQLNAAYFEQMRGPRLDSFKACEDYQSWSQSQQSCLLILSGCNNRSIMNLEQCWVSPVAIAMITDLSLSPENPVHAYHVFPAQGELLYRAFSVVILQLLRQKRQVLRNRSQCDELRTELYELQKYEGKDQKHMETDDDRLCALRKVALRVMSFFEESETVYIILDRADRCCNWKKGIDHRKPLLKALVKMVEAARCKLKVLVVIDRYQWDIEERRNELGEKTKEKVIVHTVEQEYSA